VTVENPTNALAFFVHLAVTKGQGGEEVAPAFWEDNYFSLLPGEKRTVSGTVAESDLDGRAPAVKVSGWNVTSRE
jgi:exo-1,4-beta-D-glucosaminidase